MKTTVLKGKLTRTTIAVDEERLKTLGKGSEVMVDAVQIGAAAWHDQILPKHFETGASARYGYAPRGAKYLNDKRKKGKPPLVLSGSLRADLNRQAAYRKGKSIVELRMGAKVLNLAPRIGENDQNDFVKHNSGFPNLKKEIKAMTEDEHELLAQVVAGETAGKLAPTDEKSVGGGAGGAQNRDARGRFLSR